jgi:tetratricopeptide (TPR) repeat protein/TolB-like protein
MVGALALASVAVLLVGSKSLRHAGVELPQTASGESTGANPGIAVLPFTVNDPALDTWREGMVDLLSLNLDGVPNLRAIDNRTILARWDDAVADTARPDLATALAVARQTGARYALVGSVVAAGVNLQLTADVYEVRGGAKLGRGQVTGSPDSILVLVDRLTMEILRALPREGGVLAEVDLAEVTTESLAALKAFLNGESLYRRADFKGAAAAFERAIESDPTFALASDRLGDTCGWSSGSKLCERIPWRWPDEFLSRLPKRRTELLRALYVTVEQGPVEGIAARQQMVRKYPDDPNAWYWLGDGYVHFGGWTLVDRAEADRALERAIALAPTTSAEPYIHLIEHAFADADSGRVARLLASYERVTGGAETAYPFRLAFDLGFGDPAIRGRVRAALDTVPTPILWHAMRLLTNPGLHGESYDEALRVLLARPDHSPDVAFWVFYTRGLGNLRAALDGMNDPAFRPASRALRSYRLYQVGVNFHPEELERVLAAGAGDTTTAAVYTPTYLLVGAYAVDRGHWDEYANALDRERAWARRQRVEGAYIFARRAEGGVHAMEGYALWKRGHREEAIRTLEAAQRQIWGIEGERHTPPWGPNVIVRWWLGELMLEVGRPRDAERYFKSISADPFAALRLGKVYEDLGAPKQARASYEYALLSWQHAGSELQPQIETARQGLARQLIR